MDTSLRSITCWILNFLVFASLHRSEAIVWINRPSKPTIVIEGVNSTGVKLEWNFLLHSGEVLQSVLLQRQAPGNPSKTTLASRISTTAFTFFNSEFPKEYEVKLPNTLILRDVNNNEEYVYSVIINYVHNNIVQIPLEDQVKVIVYVPPKITNEPVRKSEVNAGQKLTLICNASGDPKPDIKWTKDGVPRSQFHVAGSRLNILNAQRKDVGSYRCTASNRYGVASSISMVTVNCPSGQCKVHEVGIVITSIQWKQVFSNPNTHEHKMLKTNLSSIIASLYSMPENVDKQFYGLVAVNFRPGSALAVIQLKFDKNVTSPLKPLQDEVSDGNFGPFKVATQLDLSPNSSPTTGEILKTTTEAETIALNQTTTEAVMITTSSRTTREHISPDKRGLGSSATRARIKCFGAPFIAGGVIFFAVIGTVIN